MPTKKLLSLIFFFLLFVITVEIIIFINYTNNSEQIGFVKNINQLIKKNNQDTNNNFSFKEVAKKYISSDVLNLGEDLDNQLIDPKNVLLETEYHGKIYKIDFSKVEVNGYKFSFCITLTAKISTYKKRFCFNDEELKILKLSREKENFRKLNIADLKKGDQVKMKLKEYLFYPPDRNLINWEIIKIN